MTFGVRQSIKHKKEESIYNVNICLKKKSNRFRVFNCLEIADLEKQSFNYIEVAFHIVFFLKMLF